MYRIPKPRRYLSPEETGRASAMAQGTYDGRRCTVSEACQIFGLARGALLNQVPAFAENQRPKPPTRAGRNTTTGRGRRSGAAGGRRGGRSRAAAPETTDATETAGAIGNHAAEPAGDESQAQEAPSENREQPPATADEPGKATPGGAASSAGHRRQEAQERADAAPAPAEEIIGLSRLKPSPPPPVINTLPRHDFKTGQTACHNGKLYTVNALVGKDKLVLEDDYYNKLTVPCEEVSRPGAARAAAAAA